VEDLALIQIPANILILVLVGVQSFRLSDMSKRLERLEARIDKVFNSKAGGK